MAQDSTKEIKDLINFFYRSLNDSIGIVRLIKVGQEEVDWDKLNEAQRRALDLISVSLLRALIMHLSCFLDRDKGDRKTLLRLIKLVEKDDPDGNTKPMVKISREIIDGEVAKKLINFRNYKVAHNIEKELETGGITYIQVYQLVESLALIIENFGTAYQTTCVSFQALSLGWDCHVKAYWDFFPKK